MLSSRTEQGCVFQTLAKNGTLTTKLMLGIAAELAQRLGTKDFSGSQSWLTD